MLNPQAFRRGSIRCQRAIVTFLCIRRSALLFCLCVCRACISRVTTSSLCNGTQHKFGRESEPLPVVACGRREPCVLRACVCCVVCCVVCVRVVYVVLLCVLCVLCCVVCVVCVVLVLCCVVCVCCVCVCVCVCCVCVCVVCVCVVCVLCVVVVLCCVCVLLCVCVVCCVCCVLCVAHPRTGSGSMRACALFRGMWCASSPGRSGMTGGRTTGCRRTRLHPRLGDCPREIECPRVRGSYPGPFKESPLAQFQEPRAR